MTAQGSGGWLREQRRARGWSRAEMARRLHAALGADGGKVPSMASITRSLDGWEAGSRYPQARWRAVICQVLGITPAEFPSAPALGVSPVAAGLDDGAPRPFAAVARTLLERIGSGELPPGSRMPGVAAIAGECGVAAVAACGAYLYLEGRGVIRYVPGAGYRVRDDQRDGARRPGDEDPGVAALRLGPDLDRAEAW